MYLINDFGNKFTTKSRYHKPFNTASMPFNAYLTKYYSFSVRSPSNLLPLVGDVVHVATHKKCSGTLHLLAAIFHSAQTINSPEWNHRFTRVKPSIHSSELIDWAKTLYRGVYGGVWKAMPLAQFSSCPYAGHCVRLRTEVRRLRRRYPQVDLQQGLLDTLFCRR